MSPREMSRGSNSRFANLRVANSDHASPGETDHCFHRSDFRLQQPLILYCTTPELAPGEFPLCPTSYYTCSMYHKSPFVRNVFCVRVSTVRKPLLTYRLSIFYQYTQKHMAVRLGRGTLVHNTISAFAYTACSCESSPSASTVLNSCLTLCKSASTVHAVAACDHWSYNSENSFNPMHPPEALL